MSRRQVARGLQFLGLLIPPFGIASQLLDKVTLGESMLIALLGIAVFYAGHQMQHGD